MSENNELKNTENNIDEGNEALTDVEDVVAENNDKINISLDSENEIKHEHHSHHHGHHGHHHHHSRQGHHSRKHRRSGSSNKKPNKFLAFIKKHKSLLINILSCTISLVLLVALAVKVDVSDNNVEDGAQTVTQSTVQIETTVYFDEIPLVHNAILSYLNPNNQDTALEIYKANEGHKGYLNLGVPLHFEYKVKGLPSGIGVKSANLDISEDRNYQDAMNYELNANDVAVNIYNLTTGVQYYYRLNVVLSNDSVVGATGQFSTMETPRILKIDGIVNARDIGGWETADGKVIRKGVLFRGSELDGAVEPKYCLTESGLNEMRSVLGVRFDMDLRDPVVNKDGTDALGKNILHKYYNAPMYSAVFDEINKETMRSIFSDLADKENYPIYLHCTYGRDRTGTICYLLEALLGVSDDDLYKDYELSLFTDSYIDTAGFVKFITRVEMLEGANTQEKVEGWLLSIGVTNEKIASIREIFLEEKEK